MKSILIVDDEKLIRQGIEAMIKNSRIPYSGIFSVKNGKEAWDIIQANEISLVLTDIHMPIMNGIELIKKISESRYSCLKIVILTAYEEFEYARDAIKYKVWAYLVKPIDRGELNDVIHDIDKELGVLAEQKEQITAFTLIGGRSIPGVIEKSLQYIEENYNKDIDLAMVSNHVSLNYSYFSQIFKTATGLCFVDLLKKVRIEKAKKMLLETDNKIYEISESCGFGDPKHFMKAFRGELGVSPRQFRKKADT